MPGCSSVDNYDISKNQSNPTTLAMSVVSMFVTSSDSAVITVQYLIHSCMSLLPCSDDNTSFMKVVQKSFRQWYT
ncbi:unnamed protein product [Prunus armeniaca]|uniref:Uncharacterized protein n=1 Tax=Prunus armeniaca TaxID=36596 RepID=A0A6J5TVU4_PRUAR|nr:unnamed protein product [Prunus armeniaca]